MAAAPSIRRRTQRVAAEPLPAGVEPRGRLPDRYHLPRCRPFVVSATASKSQVRSLEDSRKTHSYNKSFAAKRRGARPFGSASIAIFFANLQGNQLRLLSAVTSRPLTPSAAETSRGVCRSSWTTRRA